MAEMTSRERLLAAIAHQETDRLPICFRGVAPLEIRWKTPLERAAGLLQLGVDDKISIRVPWVYHPEARERQWWEMRTGERYPLIIKEIETPRGALRWVVRETADFVPTDLPLDTDENWSRGVEYPIATPADLERLAYVLYDPRRAGLAGFRAHAAALRSFADTHGVLFEGTLTHYARTLGSFLGPQRMMLLMADDRPFVETLLDMIHHWTLAQIEILLDLGVDTIYSSGDYETTEFYSPSLIREAFLPRRQEQAALIHQGGARFHYFTQTGIMPLLEDYAAIGIDVLSALDPLGVGEDHRMAVDLAKVKQTIGDRICLWGGVNAAHTIERGTADDVRAAVHHAIQACGPGGGYVLSTSGSIYNTDRKAYDNLMTFVEAARDLESAP